MTISSIGNGQKLYSDSYIDESKSLLEINWTGDALESVLRLRALGEISGRISTDSLMRLAFLAEQQPKALLALLDIGLSAIADSLRDGK